jgi:hypothetical protein
LTNQFPHIARACEHLPPITLLDGEIVALGTNGRISFNPPTPPLKARRCCSSTYLMSSKLQLLRQQPFAHLRGCGNEETSQTEYTRVLRLDIVEKQALAEGNIKKLYEGKVVSSGFSGQLVQVLPTMVKALFEDFPGQSGTTRTSSQTNTAAVFGNFL